MPEDNRLLPQSVGPYQIQEVLDEGGTGAVYRAVAAGTPVAVASTSPRSGHANQATRSP
jgi:hypothetical protein